MADTTQYNLRLPADLLGRIKAAAAADGTTASGFILAAVRERLQPAANVKVDDGLRFPERAVGSLLKQAKGKRA